MSVKRCRRHFARLEWRVVNRPWWKEERQRVFTVAQNHCPKWGAAGAGHVPQRSHRPMLALSGGLVGLWGTRTSTCRRAMVSQRPETDLA